MNVGIYLYEQAEVLDFSGPFEVFSTANRLSPPDEQFNAFLIAETLAPVIARGGYSVNPQFSINDHPTIDLLIVVGGVHTQEVQNQRVIEWVKTTAKTAQLTASVCTGAFILAEADLLDGKKVTTHWQDLDDLRAAYPKLTVVDFQRWVDEGHIVTSGGISAGIDMSLHLVSKVFNSDLAEKTARQMEFEWRKN